MVSVKSLWIYEATFTLVTAGNMSVYQCVLERKRVLATSSTDSFTQVARALFSGDSELWLCAESQIQPNKTY